jgi:hypothetical protein
MTDRFSDPGTAVGTTVEVLTAVVTGAVGRA